MCGWVGSPKKRGVTDLALTSLIIQLQHLTSVCLVWVANA